MKKLETLLKVIGFAKDHALPSCSGAYTVTIGKELWEQFELLAPPGGFFNLGGRTLGMLVWSDCQIASKFLGTNKFILRNHIYQFDKNGNCAFLGVPWCHTHKQLYPCTVGPLIMVPCNPTILTHEGPKCDLEKRKYHS
jgi:hypothetical protein